MESSGGQGTVGSKEILRSIRDVLASDDDKPCIRSLSCNHDSLHVIYLATKRGRYQLGQTAVYTLHYSVRTDLGLGHTTNACRALVIHVLSAYKPGIIDGHGRLYLCLNAPQTT